MTEVMIFDPMERFLRGLQIAFTLMAIYLYFKKARKREDFNEKIILFGFGSYFIGLIVSNIFYIFTIQYFIPGSYRNHVFYGDFSEVNSLYIFLDMCVRISYALGAFLFIYSFEKTIKRTKYCLSIIQIILLIIIVVSPYDLAFILLNYVLALISTLIIIIIFYYLTKWSKFEFKAISSLMLLGFALIITGLLLGNPDLKEINVLPLLLSPLTLILGIFICLTPTSINLNITVRNINIILIIGIIVESFLIFLEITFIIFKFLVITCITFAMFTILILFIFIKMQKMLRTQQKSIKKDYSNLLAIFAKPQKLIEEFITENAKDLIIIYSAQFEIEYINEQAHLHLLGYLKEDLIGKKRTEFIHPDDFEKSVEMRKNLLQNGEEMGELRFEKKNGQYIWLEIRSVNFIDNENEEKYLSISRDITEKKEAEKILEKENRMLKELDELKDDFIIRATHDLKTPLTYMLGNANIIYDVIKEFNENIRLIPEKEKRSLHFDIKTLKEIEILAKDMCDGTIKINKMALDLLNLSLLETHRFNLKKENINVSDIIQKCVKEVNFEVKRRKIDLSCKLPERLFLNVDKQRLSEIFLNLLSNALKYTPIGGKISIFSEQNNDSINFYVKDNGIGLTNEDKEKIFTKYSKIERNEKNLVTDGFGPSYGFGLYITKGLVLSHGGEINVFSEGKNKGTMFKIKLPIK
ncbi:MAG: ATP-binding protein [Promethearchaeota archaeon]